MKLPFGNYPVLFVEYANRLSDGYYTYQAVSSSQDGDYSLFTFEVTNIDSDVNWFLELRPNVYEVTVHYGDKTDTVTLTHGQILADCDALLSSFEGSFEGQNGLFKVVGWSSEEGGNANVILVAGPDDLWAVTEFVPYTVSFEGQGFTSLSEALKALDQNASGTLDVLWGSAQELKAGEYTIPEGVTLRIPYEENGYGRKLAETTDAPSIFYADNSKGTVMLKVAEGATLTVHGTIEVGGIVGYKQSARPYQGQTSSDYSILQLDGKLNVVSGGVLDVNGYVVGNGTVTLLDGAKSKLPFIVKDYRGGTNSSNVYYENIAPFNVYEMPNIQTNYVIHYGASEMAYAMLVALDNYQEIMVEAIGANGIIRLNQGGYVVKKTTQIDNPRYSETTKAYEPKKEFRTTLDVYGGGRDGAMALNLGITSITTEGVLLAIPYTYSSVTLHDGDYTLYNMYKIMPGATLKVTEDAKLVLAAETLDGKAYQGTIITYDESFAETYSGSGPLTSSKQLLYPVQPNGVAEGGKLVVNGTLEIRGRLGADVACEVKGAKILVYAPNSNLKVTSREAVHFDKGVFTVTYEQTSSATVNGSTNLQYGNLYTSGEGGVWA